MLSDRGQRTTAEVRGRHAVDRRRQRTLLVVVGIVVGAVMFAAGGVADHMIAGSDESSHDDLADVVEPGTRQVTFLDDRRIQLQHLTEQQLQKEYDAQEHTFENPFVTLDPYDTMPLSALVMFETSEPARISVAVQGRGDDEPISRSYDAVETRHAVPVLGLYPDADNQVLLTATNKQGDQIGETTITVETDPLPDDFLQPELVTSDPDRMADGMSFMIPTQKYTYAVDDQATVRWYSSLPIKLAFERLENGHILFATKDDGVRQYSELVEMDMLGKVYKDYFVHISGYTKANVIHHDVIELPSGNLLATTHEPDSDYEQDEMIEIDRETGATVRAISDRDLFPPDSYEEYTGKNAEDNDWIHQNAIWLDDDSGDILISGRSQDSIIKLSYPDAQIDWILAAHEDWPSSYDRYLLDPVGDVKYPAGQHAVKVLPDQDDDDQTMDILLFDNNVVITRGDDDVSETYSRGLQYRINTDDRTVEEVWAYGEERGIDFYSDIIGNTQLLPDADTVLITSGAISPGDDKDVAKSRVVEVTHDDASDVVFELKTPQFERSDGRYIYRSFRWPLYPDAEWDFSLGSPTDTAD